MKREVLVSPGFGAGWATWNSEHGKQLAEDEVLVALVKAGKHKVGEERLSCDPDPEVRNAWVGPEFRARCKEICCGDEPYYGGLRDIEVRVVNGPYRIDEYDGNESITEASDEVWW